MKTNIARFGIALVLIWGGIAQASSGGVKGVVPANMDEAGLQKMIEGFNLKAAMRNYLETMGPVSGDPKWSRAKARFTPEGREALIAILKSEFSGGGEKCRDQFPGGNVMAWTEVGVPLAKVCFDVKELTIDFRQRGLSQEQIMVELATIGFHELTHQLQDKLGMGNKEVEATYEDEAKEIGSYVGWTAHTGQMPTLRWAETLQVMDVEGLRRELSSRWDWIVGQSWGVAAGTVAAVSFEGASRNSAGNHATQVDWAQRNLTALLQHANIPVQPGEDPMDAAQKELARLRAQRVKLDETTVRGHAAIQSLMQQIQLVKDAAVRDNAASRSSTSSVTITETQTSLGISRRSRSRGPSVTGLDPSLRAIQRLTTQMGRLQGKQHTRGRESTELVMQIARVESAISGLPNRVTQLRNKEHEQREAPKTALLNHRIASGLAVVTLIIALKEAWDYKVYLDRKEIYTYPGKQN